MIDRLGISRALYCLLSSTPQIIAGLIRVACPAIVVSQFGRYLSRPLAPADLLALRDPAMKLNPASRWDAVVQNITIEAVRELNPGHHSTVGPVHHALRMEKL